MKTIRAKILAIMNVGMVLSTNEISRRTGNTLEAVRVVLNRMQKDGELTRKYVHTELSDGRKTRCYEYYPAPERKPINQASPISPFAKLITSRIGA